MSSFATSLKVIRPLCRVNLATVPKRSRGYHTAEFKVSGSKVSGTNPRLDLESVSRLPRTMKSFSLTGKNALVTGGARGLGYNMATALVEAGAEKVVLVDRNAEAGEAAATELHEKYGVTARFLEMDVTDLHAIHPTIEKIFNRWGSLDVVINSAGIAE